MPRTAEDVENYLLQLDRRYENDGGTFLLSGSEGTPIALRVAPPIVAVRVTIGPAPKDAAHQLRLYEKLLKYNATDLMHVAYGLEGDEVILSAALELENLDVNEVDAVLSDLDLALARHVPSLREAAIA
jgi:hypothetical protein